jgi:YVTN family beta-propeller protein
MRKLSVLPIVLLSTATLLAQTPPRRAAANAPTRLSTVAMIDLPGHPGFEAIALANDYIVISQTSANTIDVFDPQKRRLVAQITNISQPRGIAVDAKNNRFYVAAANSVIDVVSSQDWEVKDSFTIQGSADVLALSADGLRLYAGDKTDSTVSAVDTSQRKTIASVQLPGRPESIAIADNNTVFVSVQDQALVVAIDPQMRVTSQFKLQASQPAGMVFDSASHRLYVAVRAAVLALNADNGSEIARVPAPRGVQSLYLDAASRTLFASGGGSILMLNAASGLSSTDELLADIKGHALIFDPTHKLLFMPGGREGRSKMLIVKDLKNAPASALPAASEAALR